MRAFADSVAQGGFTDVVLLGMGGSSLAPEVLRQVLCPPDRVPRFHVLDSVDPDAVRAAILKQARRWHRCLVFSQSAVGPEPALIDPRVTVWCRDSVSFSILRGAGTRVELVPDMALYMDDMIEKHPDGQGTFYIKRAPGGDTETIDHGITFDSPSGDLTWSNSLVDIVATIKPFDTVISDRLHGGLIALMMRKKVVFLPTGYHKIRAFYDTWLSPLAGAAFSQQPLRPRGMPSTASRRPT